MAFQKPTYLPVKVTPQGFEVNDEEFKELRGRVTKMTLVRKLFENGFLACSSPDGIRADNGTLCAKCKHPRCQPRLRIQLAVGQFVHLIDLATTSAENLFALEDQAETQGRQLVDWTLKLTVVNHDKWGEVVFEPIEKLPPKEQTQQKTLPPQGDS